MACAKGAIRIGSSKGFGRECTLTYVEPGAWFGEVSILDGERHTHDAYAHGASTVVCIATADFRNTMTRHVELRDALLRLHARRIRHLYGMVDDLNTLPLRARLAKQLLGASRQRVNMELKAMERADVIRVKPGGLVIRDHAALVQLVG